MKRSSNDADDTNANAESASVIDKKRPKKLNDEATTESSISAAAVSAGNAGNDTEAASVIMEDIFNKVISQSRSSATTNNTPEDGSAAAKNKLMSRVKHLEDLVTKQQGTITALNRKIDCIMSCLCLNGVIMSESEFPPVASHSGSSLSSAPAPSDTKLGHQQPPSNPSGTSHSNRNHVLPNQRSFRKAVMSAVYADKKS